mmetsp:Transcript_23164/g.66375  ORF Transcript_23164/g.66375 Transcript_23164/m.66375 type:complete len:86 (+) Transcript_23164:1437-1694(+)
MGYSRLCLPALPEGVAGHMGPFDLTTMTAVRLTRVNEDQQGAPAHRRDFGLFWRFAVTQDAHVMDGWMDGRAGVCMSDRRTHIHR